MSSEIIAAIIVHLNHAEELGWDPQAIEIWIWRKGRLPVGGRD
jgi:hypothetical protein